MRADWKLFTYEFTSRLPETIMGDDLDAIEEALQQRFCAAPGICAKAAEASFRKNKNAAQRFVLSAFAEQLAEHFSLCASAVAHPVIFERRSSTALWS